VSAVFEVALIGALSGALAYTLFWTAYVLFMPLLALSLGNRGAVASRSDSEHKTPFVVVIVPAHNMGGVITRCVSAIYASEFSQTALAVYVVADHCQDDTAARASAAGARVLVREEGPPGKTYTIAWTLEALAAHGVEGDLYVVTDATARIAPGFLACMAERWRRGEDIVVGHSVVDMDNQQWFAQCLGLTLVHRNLQNATRERLHLSALIEGRGMAYSHHYVRRHGWALALPTNRAAGTHPTEDWRHGVRVVEHGYRVSFADEARVVTPLRETLSAATRQGVRWERGRMANAGTHALTLLRRAIARRDRLMVFAALAGIQPPVAILAAISVGLALAGAFVLDWQPTLAAASVVPVSLILIYGMMVVLRGRRDGIRARMVLWAPIYVAWRCYAFAVAAIQGLHDRAAPASGPGARKC